MPGLSPEQWQALSPQLDAALDMTEEERAIWLASLRVDNPSLAEQLELLLSEHSPLARDGFLENHTLEMPGKPGLSGQSMGVYTLVSQIGQGGMGSVWLAERNDGRFERKVAVKFLNIALLGKMGEERFKREGMILGRLAHPHIAELIDAGLSSTGQPYLVLEHIEGDHIDRYCDQHGLDIPARIRLFLDVLSAVDQAHANLIVHRDLKPSNVLVRNDGQAKLLDFGIAKLLERDDNAGDAQITLDGGRAMTPEYASPEQLAGRPVTVATDIYALGVLLYVLLTGQHPAGAGPYAPADLVKAIMDTEPVRPSDIVTPTAVNAKFTTSNAAHRSTTPEKLSRTLRGDLDTIITKAVKKNPDERYATVMAFADDLDRYLKHEPISARPDTIPYRTGKFLRRHRAAVTAGMMVISALILASIMVWFATHRSEPMRQFHQRRVTANPQDLPVLNAAISPDGKYIGYGDQQGIHLQTVETGAFQNVPLPSAPEESAWVFGTWYPDSTRLVASLVGPDKLVTLWSIPITGEGARKLAEVQDMAGAAKVSPDGSKIAYARLRGTSGAREIWLIGPNGANPRRIKVAGRGSAFLEIGWSPTGNRIVYAYQTHEEDQRDILVKSCDLDGTDETVIVRDVRLDALAWTSSGRFVYSRTADPGGTESDNLWELRVDENGTPQGTSRRVTDWSGFSVHNLSSTADGKRLVFLRGTPRISTLIGELASGGRDLVNSRPLKIDDNYNIPLAWTPDSRQVIFSSKRAQTRLIYSQAIDEKSTAQLITSTSPDMNFYVARLAPQGSAILLEGGAKGAKNMALYRSEIKGGAPRLLFETDGFVQYWCANEIANLCVLGQMAAGKDELVISSFDAKGGPPKELMGIPLEPGSSARIGEDYCWQLAPDGSQIALMRRREHWIRFIPLNGGATTTVTLTAVTGLDLNWATDSHGLFVSTLTPDGAGLLYVDLQGNAQRIWQQRGATWTSGIPSPDGRHLAIFSATSDANAWMLDDF